MATTARCQNNGQSCIAAKRFIVHTDVFDAFAEKFAARMAALRVGDPMADTTDVGPLATEQGRDEVHAQVRDAVEAGATVLTAAASCRSGAGWFYPPTVVTDLTPADADVARGGLRAGRRALPGRRLRRGDRGRQRHRLRARLQRLDPRRAAEQERFATDLDAGNVFINGMTTSYPELPFGGVKNSGYGRELSALGMREFCNVKTVWVGGERRAPGPGAGHARVRRTAAARSGTADRARGSMAGGRRG